MDEFGKYLAIKGYLKHEPLDINDPTLCDRAWLASNGAKISGEISIKLYKGRPKSQTFDVESEDIEWEARFKGPLVGYLKSRDKHFVAFAPANFYSWPMCPIAIEKTVYFLINGEKGFFRFVLRDDDSGSLFHFDKWLDRDLPELGELSIVGRKLTFGEGNQASLDELEERNS